MTSSDGTPKGSWARNRAPDEIRSLGMAVAGLLDAPLTCKDGQTRGRIRAGRELEGPPGALHGGFVALLFDHVLGWHLVAEGRAGFTGRLEVRYRRPTPLEADIDIEVRTERASSRAVLARADLRAAGLLTAEAQGLFVRRRPSGRER